jgi:hypothetical protein
MEFGGQVLPKQLAQAPHPVPKDKEE